MFQTETSAAKRAPHKTVNKKVFIVGIFNFPVKTANGTNSAAAIAIFGMVMLVGFRVFMEMDFDLAFVFAILSGVFYAIYMLLSKYVLYEVEVLPFITISTLSSAFFLAILSYGIGQPFSGFSTMGWIVLVIQGVVCQLLAWLLLGYATKHMKATRVSVSLLGQAVLTTILAWLFIGEEISLQMILGGVILLFGIRITFYSKKLGFNALFKGLPNSQ